MAKAVAKDGDAKASVGAGLPSTVDAGTWTAGAVTTTPDPKLSLGGTHVITQASCTFTMTNGTKGGNPVPVAPSTVTLTGAATKLQAAHPPLRDGDEAKDSFGNTVKVTVARPKLTSG